MFEVLFVSLPIFLSVGGIVGVIFSSIVSKYKDEKKLELDSAKNYVDIKRIFSRINTYLSLSGEQSMDLYDLKKKLNNLDTFVYKLNDEELSRFLAQCIDEMPALLKIQKMMLTPKFNVKNETLMELIAFVIDNLIVHYKEWGKSENLDLKGELELLKAIKEKREVLISHANKS